MAWCRLYCCCGVLVAGVLPRPAGPGPLPPPCDGRRLLLLLLHPRPSWIWRGRPTHGGQSRPGKYFNVNCNSMKIGTTRSAGGAGAGRRRRPSFLAIWRTGGLTLILEVSGRQSAAKLFGMQGILFSPELEAGTRRHGRGLEGRVDMVPVAVMPPPLLPLFFLCRHNSSSLSWHGTQL